MTLPKSFEPVVDKEGKATVPWFRFFERLSGKGPASEAQTLSASPATITFSSTGFLTVNGGTVSLIEYRRGTIGAFASTGVIAGPQPFRNGDAIRITYSSAPTVILYAD